MENNFVSFLIGVVAGIAVISVFAQSRKLSPFRKKEEEAKPAPKPGEPGGGSC